MKKQALLLAGGLCVAAAAAVALLPGQSLRTADHLDPPGRTSPDADSTPDRAADIADILAWAEGGNLNVIVTFAGPADPDAPATYDRDVLYKVNISTDGNPLNTENVVRVRFGQDGPNEFGVQATGVPGANTLSGPVNTDLTRNGATLRAGLFDDPFFFDLQGFMETLQTGDLSIRNDRDFFAGQNDTAFVLQIPLDTLNATGKITVWSETLRFGGNI
ncbi:DUF4331 family protein [Erythrobacter litoralis]|nr:DUF4331 family protein [Erythrobacter litoralis]